MENVTLGVTTAKEEISGIAGTLTAKFEEVGKVTEYAIQPHGTDKDGKPYDRVWFSENRIQLT